jgi:hypothetical protein
VSVSTFDFFFEEYFRVLLAKIPEQDGKMSYVYDKHIFHYIVDAGMTFLCMADESTKRRITFAFLEDIKTLWREKYGSVEQSALAFSLNDIFSPVLRQRMEYFSENPNAADGIARVQAQIDNVKEVMVENIDRVLERGEKIELLVDKTEKLNQQAFKFEKTVSGVLSCFVYLLSLLSLFFFGPVSNLEARHVFSNDDELMYSSVRFPGECSIFNDGHF